MSKKELLDTENASLTIESSFSLDSLSMKKDLVWHFRVLMHANLPRFYQKFDATLLVDEEPYLRRIKSLEEKLEQAKAEPTMFDNGQATEIRKELDEANEELETIKEKCEPIVFPARVEEIKYKNRATLTTFIIPNETVAEINAQRDNLRYYKISLEPKL